MGKSDRAFLVGLYCAGLAFWPPLVQYTGWIFAAACLLSVITLYNRVMGILEKPGEATHE